MDKDSKKSSKIADVQIAHASLTLSHGNFIGFQLLVIALAVAIKTVPLRDAAGVPGLIIFLTVLSLVTGVFTFYLCIQTWIVSMGEQTIFGELPYIMLIIVNLLVMIATIWTCVVLVEHGN
jgi:hypothetical protein